MKVRRSMIACTAKALVALVVAGTVLVFAPRPVLAEVPTDSVETIGINITALAGGAQGAQLVDLKPFSMVALSWTGDATPPTSAAFADRGTWTGHDDLDAESLGPDAATSEAAGSAPGPAQRHWTTQPVWVGRADGILVTTPPGMAGLEVHLIRETTELKPAVAIDTASSHSAGGSPPIHSRAEWDAAAPVSAPEYAPAVRYAVVHHTVNSNDYSEGDVPSMLRGIQAYHQQTNGWNDIGYNFLVDKFGRIWEARGGGYDRAVIGAHAGGFNTGSVGIAVLGRFDTAAPSDAAVDAVGSLVGWKLAKDGADPLGSVTVTVGQTDTVTRYPIGSTVTLPTVVGHGDLDATACPGSYLYERLGDVRQLAGSRYPNQIGRIESAVQAPSRIDVAGWAFDRSSQQSIYVDLYLDGAWVVSAPAYYDRPDVAGAFPDAGRYHGFYASLPLRAPGNHTLCAYGINDGPGYNYSIGCTTVGVRADPFGSLDIAVAGPRLAYVAGWAIEPEMSGAVEVDVSVDGAYAGHRFASVTRSDIGNDYPAWGGWHGFGFTVPMLPGTHNVCATAINQGYGTHTVIGCRSVTLGTDPIGYIDYAAVNPSSNVATIAGWAIEPEMSGAIEVDVSLDGSYAALGWASQTRSDIANLYGFYGGWHGFSINVTVPPGTHTLCATAINQGWGSSTRLGCRSVVVP